MAHRDTVLERGADALVHLLGLAMALPACLALAAALPRPLALRHLLALAAYGGGLLAMTLCSALYNMAPPGRAKARLRRLDHAAIFAMIAGTYTPVALLGMGEGRGGLLLALVWAGALGGAALKLFAPAKSEALGILAYLLLGWAGVAAGDAMLAVLSARDLRLLLAGGLLYSLGVAVHLASWLRFHDALWHALVLAAAACHYMVVFRLLAAA